MIKPSQAAILFLTVLTDNLLLDLIYLTIQQYTF